MDNRKRQTRPARTRQSCSPFVAVEAFANAQPQSMFSGSAGVPFSRPGLNTPGLRALPRSRMASFFRGHRARARREASLRAAALAASLGMAGWAGLDGAAAPVSNTIEWNIPRSHL
jgi:hypothetical protein